jgi:hypothetical protein
MCSHLFSLHPSIWDIVENGLYYDNNDDAIHIHEQILCRDEYNKVSGLDNAKEIWDTIKIARGGDYISMITKMELVEGELGRFAMKRVKSQPTHTTSSRPR